MYSQNNSIERAEKIINTIVKHLDTENCQHCKNLLSEAIQ
jgi:3-methyladenine DNA glycosylase/8-oxoguanine DNA glycosylase